MPAVEVSGCMGGKVGLGSAVAADDVDVVEVGMRGVGTEAEVAGRLTDEEVRFG